MSALTEILLRKRDDLTELELFSQVCYRAINMAENAVENIDLQQRIAKALDEPSPFPTPEKLESAIKHAEGIAKFASEQNSLGSPYLYGLCSVRLWGALEALADELVIECMKSPTTCPDQKLLSRLKGPLLDFISARPEEQAAFLAETLKQAVEAPLKLGVGRFEAILAPVGLSGGMDDRVQRNLYELSQVRNVIVHKSGRADRKLCEACPWLDIKVGDSIHIGKKAFEKYHLSTYWYLLELRGRIDKRENRKRSEELISAMKSLTEALSLAEKTTLNTPKAERQTMFKDKSGITDGTLHQ